MSPSDSSGRPAAALAFAFRGEHVESSHSGSIAVVSEDGTLLWQAGDPERLTYLRSAAKPFQLNPFVSHGGDCRYGFSPADLALAAASHGGEPSHTSRALSMLQKGGFSESDLHCGAHPPLFEAAAHDLIRRGEAPTQLHNNCSGKHAAMLLGCQMLGFPASGYHEPDHPYQRIVIDFVSRATGTESSRLSLAVDGCSVPVFRMPLRNLALGYGRLFGSGTPRETESEALARAKIAAAMAAHPEMVAGTGRFTTRIMQAFEGKLLAKEGADGVYGVSVAPELAGHMTNGKALGIALKIEDGGERCRDLIVVSVLRLLGLVPERLISRVEELAPRDVRNVRGDRVGEMRPAIALQGPISMATGQSPA
ncbi:MAG: asparaginase [Thermoanaerobaculia bacterium]|nr:asparaginase [Thermoanaerobaculia bacterium]